MHVSNVHRKLANVMKAFGYSIPMRDSKKPGHPQEPAGVCGGFIPMWIQAAVLASEEEDIFFERLMYLNKTQTEELIRQIQLSKDKKGKNLTDHDRKMLDLQAFLDGVALYQEPKKVLMLDQQQFIKVSEFISSQKLGSTITDEKKVVGEGGLAKFYLHVVIGDESYLTNYFLSLQKLFIALGPPSIPMTLGCDNHLIGLRFDLTKNKWILVDANRLPQQEIDPDKIAEQVMTSFWDENICGFTTTFYSTAKRADKLKSIFEKTEEKRELSQQTEIDNLVKQFRQSHAITKEVALKKTNRNVTALWLAERVKLPHIANQILDLFQGEEYHHATLKSEYLGIQPLYLSIQSKDNLAIEKLIKEFKADINQCREDGWTPLITAADDNYLEGAKFLLQHNAQVNLANPKNGQTALHRAVRNGHSDMTVFLLDHKADIEAEDTISNSTPLLLATINNKLKTLKLLISRGAIINIENKKGGSPLFYAVKNNAADTVRCLIEDGHADPILPCKNGIPLVIAIKNKQWSCLIHLLMGLPPKNAKSNLLTLLNDRAIKQEISKAFLNFVNTLPQEEQAIRIQDVIQQMNWLGILLNTPDVPLLKISYFKKPPVVEEVKKFAMEKKLIK